MNNISFYGSETSGSIAKRILAEPVRNTASLQAPQGDSVNFKGREKDEKGSSAAGAILGIAAITALAIGGLGYAHKAGWISKLNDGKFKDTANKAAEKCHDWCAKIKATSIKYYNKVKDFFSKKS